MLFHQAMSVFFGLIGMRPTAFPSNFDADIQASLVQNVYQCLADETFVT